MMLVVLLPICRHLRLYPGAAAAGESAVREHELGLADTAQHEGVYEVTDNRRSPQMRMAAGLATNPCASGQYHHIGMYPRTGPMTVPKALQSLFATHVSRPYSVACLDPRKKKKAKAARLKAPCLVSPRHAGGSRAELSLFAARGQLWKYRRQMGIDLTLRYN